MEIMSEPELCISNNIICGLKNLGNSINVETSKKLIANTIKLTLSDLNIPSDPEIYTLKPELAKQSEYALAQLLILSTKYNYSNEKLEQLLNTHNVPVVICTEIIKTYEQSKKKILAKLIQNGISYPNAADINWKLQCDIKTNVNEKSEITYILNLIRFNEETNEQKTIVEFASNTEELQKFLSNLKDIENQLQSIIKN